MKKIIPFILLICSFSCKTDNKTNSSTKNKVEVKQQIKKTKPEIEIKYVVAKSGLNYRKSSKGEVVGKFKYGEKLEIIEHTTIFESIEDENELIKGEWLGIKVNDNTVYTFGGYLANEKPISEPKEEEEEEEEDLYTILLPSTYRDWENKNPVDHLNKTWIALFKKDSKYYINKASYTIELGENECSGDSTKTVNTQNKTLLFIKDSSINYGEIYHHKIEENKIWPEEEIALNYNNIEYKIRAEGEFISPKEALIEKDSNFYADVKNYKLYISTNNNNESLFLEEKSFNDTFVKLLFIGDIDSDGKLDFIFEANRHYEEKRVILYLSSIADKSEIIKKSGEIAIGFSC